MEMNDMVIVSIDDHAIEPPEAFIRHYPAGKKDRRCGPFREMARTFGFGTASVNP